jgi:hypothetical protein
MLQVDESQNQQQDQDAEIETLHVYVAREEVKRPSVILPALSLLALSFLLAICITSSYRQPLVRTTLRVAAVFPPTQVYAASAMVKATGKKTFQATVAHGTLTLTNGSVVGQDLPAGLVFATSSGVEVITQTGVFVPAGSALGYGYATVSAKAVTGGVQGNIPTLSINAVYGTSLYIRNLKAFTGGKNSYSVKIETAQDRQIAISAARETLTTQAIHLTTYLVRPCSEISHEHSSQLTLVWSCQYMTFAVPAYMQVVTFRLVGKNVLVDVEYTPRPAIIWFK